MMQLLLAEERRLEALDERAGLTSTELGQLRRARAWRQEREARARSRKQQEQYAALVQAALAG